MRTAIFILGGLALWALFLGASRIFTHGSASALTTATVAFVAIWLVIAAGNMWGGVVRAGYTLREELPIFALIFLLPVAVAILVKWQLL
jgi:hypothetical protein